MAYGTNGRGKMETFPVNLSRNDSESDYVAGQYDPWWHSMGTGRRKKAQIGSKNVRGGRKLKRKGAFDAV